MPVASNDLSPEEKMDLLRKHWGEGVALAELARRFGIPVRELDHWRRQLLERGAQVFRDQAIPVGLKFEFEQFAATACEKAKMDGKDRALAARNLVNQLEQDWLAKVEGGLGTEAATRKVYEAFGTVEQAAECLRQPIWLRLLFYEDYRPHRMLTAMAFCFLLGVSGYAKYFHQSQFLRLSVSASPSAFLTQFVGLLLPLVTFLVPPATTSREPDGVGKRAKLDWWPHLKVGSGTATIFLLTWQLIFEFLNVPFFLVAVDAWTSSVLRLTCFWLLGLAAIPALGCIMAETFIRPGAAGEKARRRFLAFLHRCDGGRFLIGG